MMGRNVCVPVHVSTIVAVVHFRTDDSCTRVVGLQLFIISTMTEAGKKRGFFIGYLSTKQIPG